MYSRLTRLSQAIGVVQLRARMDLFRFPSLAAPGIRLSLPLVRSLRPSLSSVRATNPAENLQSEVKALRAEVAVLRSQQKAHHENHESSDMRFQLNCWKYISAAMAVLTLNHFLPTYLTKKHDNTPKKSHGKCEAVVYTWHPYSTDNGGGIGHQSLLIKGPDGVKRYISFWPQKEKIFLTSIIVFGKVLGVGGRYVSSIDEDIQLEGGRDPDRISVIHNLDFEKILAFLYKLDNQIKNGDVRYTFFHNTPSVRTKYPHNCTSIVRTILEKGGYPKQPRSLALSESPIGQSWSLRRVGAHPVVTNSEEFDKLISEAGDDRNDELVETLARNSF